MYLKIGKEISHISCPDAWELPFTTPAQGSKPIHGILILPYAAISQKLKSPVRPTWKIQACLCLAWACHMSMQQSSKCQGAFFSSAFAKTEKAEKKTTHILDTSVHLM